MAGIPTAGSAAFDALVIGAGQAGLAVSHHLTEAGIGHAVLERGRVGQTWRGRWDSFCLVILRKRKSSLLIGVGEDAALVAGQIAALGARIG